MTNWPDGWQVAMLENADIPATAFALQVINLWQQATPTQRWTNNPLGIPAHGYSASRAGNTAYAAFPTFSAMNAAFKLAAHSKLGKPLYTALAQQDKLTVAWRAIHALGWPANDTETDYPATILDAVTDSSVTAMKASKASDRRSVGTGDTRTDVHGTIATHGQAFYQSAANIRGSARALTSNLGRVNRRGG